MQHKKLDSFRILDILIKYKESVESMVDLKYGDYNYQFAVLSNRNSPVQSMSEMNSLLGWMYQQDLIFFEYTRTPFRPLDTQNIYIPVLSDKYILQDIAYKTTKDIHLFIGLTPKGGNLWEKMANPYWNLYMNMYTEDITTEVGARVRREFGSREIALHYLSIDKYKYNIIEEGSVRMSKMIPWQATYWKSLHEGIKLTYKLKPKNEIATSLHLNNYNDILDAEDRQPLRWYTDPETLEQLQ